MIEKVRKCDFICTLKVQISQGKDKGLEKYILKMIFVSLDI